VPGLADEGHAGAEQGLVEALSEGGSKVGEVADWLALFDLYRATGQLAPFESKAVDFVNRFNRSAPQWYDMPSAVSSLAGKNFVPSAQGSARAVWACDAEVDAHSVGTLQTVLMRAKQPWVIDWTALVSMD